MLSGLNYLQREEINVLEIGFGTGLNAFLTLLASHQKNLIINYTALEAFPLPKGIINQLNYEKQLKISSLETQLFDKLHQVEWENSQKITTYFQLKKNKIDLALFQGQEPVHLIYFDAFAPDVQPEMWIKLVFEKMFNCLVEGGILVTYCAKGIVKRTLKEVGFTVEMVEV